jgi:hypothetical protein
LQEALILALQLVVEDYAPNVATTLSDLLCRVLVRAMKVRVVCDLGAPREASVEALPIVERAVGGGVQLVAASLGEGPERGPGTPGAKGTGLDQPRVPQVLDLPIAAGPCAGVGWLKVALRDGAEGADRR